MPRPCRHCHSLEHTAFYCRRRPRTPLNTKKTLKQTGKVGKQWLLTRETWFKKHPAAYYTCYLQLSPDCLGSMTKQQTTLDHIKSRSRHPELRYTLSNLAPACYPCNLAKGSRDIDEL